MSGLWKRRDLLILDTEFDRESIGWEKLMTRLTKAILSVGPLSHEYKTRRSREGCVDTTRVIPSRVR